MMHEKPRSAREQAEQHLQEEALRIAKSTQSPGQTKEQTKLIAKGIEKGIALYKQQQSAKARERDRSRKKLLRQKLAHARRPDSLEPMPDSDRGMANLPILVAGAIFFLVALFHGLRYLKGWHLVFEGHDIPSSWSVAGFVISGGLAYWMFRSTRD